MESFKTPDQSNQQMSLPSSLSASAQQSKGFSLDTTSKPQKNHIGVVVPPNFSIYEATGNESSASSESPSGGDPFLSGGSSNITIKPRKLSPTANPFLPRQLVAIPEICVLETIQGNLQDSILQTPSTSSSMTSDHTLKESEASDINPMAEGIFDHVYPLGHFADDRYTRYLKVTGVPGTLNFSNLKILVKGKTYRAPKSIIDLENLRLDGVILLGFTSIVDAVNAAGEIPNNMISWNTDFINARQFSEKMSDGKGPLMSIHEGQLAIIATHTGPQNEFSEIEIVESVVHMIKNHGSVLAWDVVKTTMPHHVYIRMEYYDVNESVKAKEALHGTVFGALELSVKDYTPNFEMQDEPVSDVTTSIDEELSTVIGSFSIDKPLTGSDSNSKQPVTPTDKVAYDFAAAKSRSVTTSAYRLLTSPTHVSLSPYPAAFPANVGYGYGFAGNPYVIPPIIGSPATLPCVGHSTRRAARMSLLNGYSGNSFGSGNNVVNVHRIVHGQDVRTTIMLRNIPNKMPQAELKQFMDETNFGEYDFMYLRIDFANNCNVGYAFINFVDPLAIAKFVTARAGTKWARYNSDKVAEISYATIQGKDCLIQKFRNSSVMLEDPSFRPKLFHTSTGPLAGKEDIFPGPDNDSKLRRSIENAGAVGLFAPRAGQFFREAQRRRRSQFDRGTHFAQIEEESYGPEYGYDGFGPNSFMGPSMLPYSAPPHRLTF